MFWYAISLTGEWTDPDDLRFTEDRGVAIVAMKVCGLKVRAVAKPLPSAQ